MQNKFWTLRIAIAMVALYYGSIVQAEHAVVIAPTLAGHVPVQSWKTLRDKQVIKQDKDFSCGAASLATILKEFYDIPVTERDLLLALDNEEMCSSFEDMQRVLPQFGFRAHGYAVTYEQLAKLKIPVIVYLKHRKDEHFSVLRGISEDTVWLADPSLGNRTYSKAQFLEIWETRGNSNLKGKFLAVVPEGSSFILEHKFFTRTPERQTAQAIKQLVLRPQ
ncbi:C39 family peptidase [Noviherbaspirillum aerium]|uniref:C39 family peptidase n=1 Tax=Noviherbaspirillum aerium TaxID=2588497 RepID=UPI001CEF7350|nr:C39 family peptidase [Noviherbaspirillum aerium]